MAPGLAHCEECGRLRSQYMLGYYTNNPDNDGKYRRVKVAVNQPNPKQPLNVVWRHGYYAPID